VTGAYLGNELHWDDQPPPLCPCESSLSASDEADDCESEEEETLGTEEAPEEGDAPVTLSFRGDLTHSPATLWEDAKGVVNWNNGLILAAAGGAAVAMREGDADREVREWVNQHPHRWGDAGQFLGKLGDVRYQAPMLFGVYGYSVWSQDEELHDVMGSVMSASAITGVSTTVLKVITNTDRPSTVWNHGHFGFPSYHTASSFAIAAVLDEYYGASVGLPAYALASAIGFSRLDEKDHDLSDVFFGGALGFVIGKAVAGRHIGGSSQLKFAPYFHPTDGSPGVACEARF